MRRPTARLRIAGCLMAAGLVMAACSDDGTTSSGSASPDRATTDEATTDPATTESATPESLTYRGYAGISLEAQKKAFLEPFAAATGIEVNTVDATYDDIRAMVDAGETTIDMAETDPFFALGNCGTYAEPLDYSIIDTTDLPAEFVSECAVPSFTYAVMLAYNPDVLDSAPRSWTDFFDTEAFPGKRAIYGESASGGTLEIALLADGVAPEDLYPLDVDRALAKLDTIRDDLVIFDTMADSERLMVEGDVAMIEGWQARVLGARLEGSRFKVIPSERIVAYDVFMVPKGTPNRELGMRLIAEAVGVAAQEEYSSVVPYGAINRRAKPTALDEEHKDLMIGDYRDEAVIQDQQWWAENHEAATQAWEEWLATFG